MENLNKTDIGLIGLAVMGENLALNMADKGIRQAPMRMKLVARCRTVSVVR